MTVKELCEKCVNMGNGKIALYNAYDNHLSYIGNYNDLSNVVKKFSVSAWEFCQNKENEFTLKMKVSL